jgi:opacity protein-like surface antigen
MRNFFWFSLLTVAISGNAWAQSAMLGKRAGQWETSAGIYSTSSLTASGSNGSSIDVDSGYGLAFSLGYNVTDQLAVRFDGSWTNPDYTAVVNTVEDGPFELDHELSLFTGQFSGVWNLLPGAFTPYLQAGIGWTYVDSNVADGPPTTGCWWDPWWGYICSDFFSTYSDTSFSWNIGAGLRYELSRSMFVRGGYELLQLDGGEGVDPDFDNFRIELGWKF